MPRIIPIKDMRNTNEISKICHESKEPVFVTKQGYGDLVVMSMETYNQLIGLSEIDAAIGHAEAELAAGTEPIEQIDKNIKTFITTIRKRTKC